MESKKYPELYLSSGLEKIVSAFPPIKCGTAPKKPKQPQCPKEPSNDPGCVSFGIAFGVLAIFAYCLGAQKNVDIPIELLDDNLII